MRNTAPGNATGRNHTKNTPPPRKGTTLWTVSSSLPGSWVRYPTGAAQAAVTAIHHDPTFYLLSIAGADGYGCTPAQVVRVLDEREHHHDLGGAPGHNVNDRVDHGRWVRRPVPDLTGYLVTLAAQCGYDVDLAELDPT